MQDGTDNFQSLQYTDSGIYQTPYQNMPLSAHRQCAARQTLPILVTAGLHMLSWIHDL